MKKNNTLQAISYCLIGGSGRSGTTILKKIFAQHPDVAYVPEWRFTIDPDGLIDFYNTFSTGWSPFLVDVKLRRLERLLKDIGQSNRSISSHIKRIPHYIKLEQQIPYKLVPKYVGLSIVDYCPNYLDLVDQLIRNLAAFRYQGSWIGAELLLDRNISYSSPYRTDDLAHILGEFIRQMSRCAVENQGAKYYVEDNTWNILWFDKILKLVPEAKLVHIYRDPRDVVASYTKQRWTPSDPVQSAQVYQGLFERWWQVRQSLPPESFAEISLESLVADPKLVLRQLCELWEIEWHKSLLETDLSHSNSGRWKRDLTLNEQQQVSEILAEQIVKLGYK
ncbi:MAG: sulfotransferase [Deltaproteobacteria bacterium]|nr:sulfotransferase [Deltaproteobacteria bacterium]